ncbi:MAG TPA: VCBS repeat-containing protein [Acidobacteriaceae bacterium]|nr:VCBS repeat-containing protein [Acidobacteriaceae bacterium]
MVLQRSLTGLQRLLTDCGVLFLAAVLALGFHGVSRSQVAPTAGSAAGAASPASPPPGITAPFQAHTIATGILGGYQVLATDMNHDGKIDLIGLGTQGESLTWYENPSWTPHAILPLPRMINVDASDLDGDGIPELAVAYGFSSNPAKAVGNLAILHCDSKGQWTAKEIDRVPTAHRVRFADLEGNGKKVLIVAPIMNAQSTGFTDPANLPTPLLMYRPQEWKREVITEENRGVVHGLLPYDWFGNGRQDILTAGYSGVFVHSYGKDGRWTRTEIAQGSPAPWPHGGAGEIAVGKIRGKQFFVTVEPFHGNMVVVYMQDSAGHYQRHVIDTALLNGHSLTLVDVDGDGIPEIVAGGSGSRANLFFYKATDATGQNWQKMLMDNDISAQSCVTADIRNSGKRSDVVCMDARPPNALKWYEYTGKPQ